MKANLETKTPMSLSAPLSTWHDTDTMRNAVVRKTDVHPVRPYRWRLAGVLGLTFMLGMPLLSVALLDEAGFQETGKVHPR